MVRRPRLRAINSPSFDCLVNCCSTRARGCARFRDAVSKRRIHESLSALGRDGPGDRARVFAGNGIIYRVGRGSGRDIILQDGRAFCSVAELCGPCSCGHDEWQ
jgi:hypothetical protein